MITGDSTPRLAPGVRLQPDRVRGGFNLLSPEHVLRLNASSAAILQLCDGQRSLGEIVDHLAGQFAAEREQLANDVTALIETLQARRLVET